ncbi:uncharacterized protein LOC115099251 [Rhinatrema bivittatum]|uniref:uncharacterized protein LOC115088052 n=1 Tax=Rhinatrema bivittatum TaxID=194408 RepID=UPI00112B9FE9|nr:uncharacterized protein LOC115088052 [Rhinatrema bivittatum]XP_029469697.1 uncharacterized protein LOC115097789 [Rhinatrema bivittatum]XP_029472604.1 uncharacterized protein LOC115099251 [Rhinatrema bivittatum]
MDWEQDREGLRAQVPSSGPVGLALRRGKAGQSFQVNIGTRGNREVLGRGGIRASSERGREVFCLSEAEDDARPGTSRQEAWRERDFEDDGGGRSAGSETGGQDTKVTRVWEAAQSAERRQRSGEQEWAWVVGHSFIHWAQHRAENRPYGTHLELENRNWKARWLSHRGMRCDGLLPFLQTCVMEMRMPKVLLIHLGGNDLGHGTCKDLITNIKKDFSTLFNVMPETTLGWSDIILRIKFLGMPLWHKSVKKMNKLGSGLCSKGGFG